MRYVALVFLVGCGGPEFSAGLLDAPHPDAALEPESAPVDSGTGGADATDGGGSEEDGRADGGEAQACTLLPTAQGQRAYGCAPYAHPDGSPVDGPIPAMFAWQTGSTCGIAPTPAECQCATAFTCACLRAAGVCVAITGTAWVGCNDQASNMPTVTCQ